MFAELENKAAISDYLIAKVATVKKTGSKVYAELGFAQAVGVERHCVLMAQDKKKEVVAIILFEIKNSKISRCDMCLPQLYRLERTGIYPI